MKDDNIILDVNDLNVRFYQDEGIVKATNGVSYQVNEGKSVGIVGESGCGKTVSTYAVLNILPPSGEITEGQINYRKPDGSFIDITELDPDGEEMYKIRGRQISMIFQEPMTAFSPVHTIYNQIAEAILVHQDISEKEAKERVVELLGHVGISNPSKRLNDYPFQFSGGMRQRAMIAMALASNPRILIADEPTTALDVTIQAQVLQLIKEMQDDFNLSLVLITHDLGVIAHMVDEVYVMYLGQVMESGPVKGIYHNTKHPYTRDLLLSIPKIQGNEGKIASIEGSVPDTYSLPSGCPFHTRCRDYLGDICSKKTPKSVKVADDHYVSCFKYSGSGVKEECQ